MLNIYILIKQMLRFGTIFLLSFFSKSIAQTDIQAQEPYYYGNTLFYKPQDKVSCNNIEDKLPENFYNIAINSKQYLNGSVCGNCISGVMQLKTLNKTNKAHEFNGIIINEFPGLYNGDLVIYGKNIYDNVVWPTKWKFIKCPYTDNQHSHKPTHSPIIIPAGKTCENAIMHANKRVCCPKSCKICGEKNCNLNREGEGNCCYTGIIRLHNRSCEKFPAPCVI